MNRGDFLKTGLLGLGTLSFGTSYANSSTLYSNLIEEQVNGGVFSAMCSFRVSKAIHLEIESEIKTLLSNKISEYAGFKGASLKQMVGDSTMVKNMPVSYKGMLANAMAEGAEKGTMPYVYLLLVRFDTFENLKNYSNNNLIKDYLKQENYMYSPKGKTNNFLEFFGEPMITVAAGNRNEIFESPNQLNAFLAYKHEIKNAITVANHVTIKAEHTEAFEEKVKQLLKIAQSTYQPANTENGLAGGKDNLFYKKALTTEILRGAKTQGDYRNYIMHGVWESYWDHENSHIDKRFKSAAAPVGAFVIKGPVEPFYTTLFQI